MINKNSDRTVSKILRIYQAKIDTTARVMKFDDSFVLISSVGNIVRRTQKTVFENDNRLLCYLERRI